MEKIEDQNQNAGNSLNQMINNHARAKVFGGIVIIAAGILLMLREIGTPLPHWIFSWGMILILIGTYVGIKHDYKNFAWVVLYIIGGIFLVDEFYSLHSYRHFFWPIMLIVGGVYMIGRSLGRRNRYGSDSWRNRFNDFGSGQAFDNSSDFLEANAVFGSSRQTIISKKFVGGEVNSVFGSSEINLMQADFEGTAVLEVNSVFGGTRLLIPSNWTIKSEVNAVFGGVEDKRIQVRDSFNTTNKVLILKGSAVFGGIDIKSF